MGDEGSGQGRVSSVDMLKGSLGRSAGKLEEGGHVNMSLNPCRLEGWEEEGIHKSKKGKGEDGKCVKKS